MPRCLTSTIAVSMFVLAVLLIAPAAGAQELVWENRGQAEFTGSALDIGGGGNVVVAAGDVGDNEFNAQWFVRGLDREQAPLYRRTGSVR